MHSQTSRDSKLLLLIAIPLKIWLWLLERIKFFRKTNKCRLNLHQTWLQSRDSYKLIIFRKSPLFTISAKNLNGNSSRRQYCCEEKKDRFFTEMSNKGMYFVKIINLVVAVQSQWIVGLKRVDFNPQWLKAGQIQKPKNFLEINFFERTTLLRNDY